MATFSSVGEGRIGGDTRRYTVRDAADILGITTGAVRNRLSRGTLQSIKEGDTVYVVLPERHTERDTGDIPGESAALISPKTTSSPRYKCSYRR